MTKRHTRLLVALVLFYLTTRSLARGQIVQQLTRFDLAGNRLQDLPTAVNSVQSIRGLNPAPNGDIWVSYADNNATLGIDNPNDRVVRIDRDGNELQTIQGPFRQPGSVAVDSLGHVYVTGSVQGTFENRIFKFESDGDFLFSFGDEPNGFGDMQFTQDDRLFVSSSPDLTIREFTTAGEFVRSRNQQNWRGGSLELTDDDMLLWSLEANNLPGSDQNVLSLYDSDDLRLTRQFFLEHPIRDFRRSLQILDNGNLLTVNAQDQTIDGLLSINLVDQYSTSTGELLERLELRDVAAITRLVLEPDQTLLVQHRSEIVPEPNGWFLCLMGMPFLVRRRAS